MLTQLLEYVLQEETHNRLTPRVIDIAYTAFMCAKASNKEDGGPTDWFTDTRPVIQEAIAKLRKDLSEEPTPAYGAPTPDMVDAARPLFLALECGETSIEGVREAISRGGYRDIGHLPRWFREGKGHLTKSGRAELAYRMMRHAA